VVDYIEQEVEDRENSMIVNISEVVGVDTKVMATAVETDKTEEEDTKTTPEVIKFARNNNVVATLTKMLLKTRVTDSLTL